MSNVISLQRVIKNRNDHFPKPRDRQHDFIMDMASYCLEMQPQMNVRDKAKLLRVLANLLETTEDPIEALS
ncbi:MAG: hypothetical protein Q8M31_02905 [Beijerinckiaceae bacterium]|nr:hypothetical protein [Beijerinckiaceae bacterium]